MADQVILTEMERSSLPAVAQPTIADVAALAGVSRAVASRALSSASRPVSDEKRNRVLKAAEELGYRANLLAQSLVTKSVNLVAVVANHIHDLSDLGLFDLLLEQIQAQGKQVILIRVGTDERVEEFLKQGIAYHVDAALVFSDFADAATVRKTFRTDNLIMLNGRHDEASASVTPDERIGIAQAVGHAAANGVKRAALLTGRRSSEVERLRVEAFHDSFREHGVELVTELSGDYSYECGRASADTLLAEQPDAVFCCSDAMAMGVMDARRADFLGNRWRRFRLYGFDNLQIMADGAYPIASIGYDKTDYVREIMTLMRGGIDTAKLRRTVPTVFVPRASA